MQSKVHSHVSDKVSRGELAGLQSGPRSTRRCDGVGVLGGDHGLDAPPARGVVARIVTGPHDANRQDPHVPMRYDTGRPRAVIRFRISQPRTVSLPCPAGLRARRPSPMMDVSRKNVFSTRPWRWYPDTCFQRRRPSCFTNVTVRSRAGDRGPWPDMFAVLAGGMMTVAPRGVRLRRGDWRAALGNPSADLGAGVPDHLRRRRQAVRGTPDRHRWWELDDDSA